MEKYDLNHYYEIIKARKAMGYEKVDTNIEVKDYFLLGKKMKNTETGNIYNIEKVRKQWYGGWYILLLIECNKSHTTVFWENINCIHDTICDSIERNKTKYLLLED